MAGSALHLYKQAVGKKEKAKVIRRSGKFEVGLLAYPSSEAMSNDWRNLWLAETGMRRRFPHPAAAMPPWEESQTASPRLAHVLGEVGTKLRCSSCTLRSATIQGHLDTTEGCGYGTACFPKKALGAILMPSAQMLLQLRYQKLLQLRRKAILQRSTL